MRQSFSFVLMRKRQETETETAANAREVRYPLWSLLRRCKGLNRRGSLAQAVTYRRRWEQRVREIDDGRVTEVKWAEKRGKGGGGGARAHSFFSPAESDFPR